MSLHKTCCICLESITNDQFTKTTCNHYFHKNCLCPWVDRCNKNGVEITCPICRYDITQDFPKIIYFQNKIKIIKNKDSEIRYYPNNNIKYRIYLDSNDNVISGVVFSLQGIRYDIESFTLQQIQSIRTCDYNSFII